jgi:electron transfer flavoprotein beta subunit
LNIIVPIKQVPETNNVKMDENTGTMVRDGVESIVNPLDLYAIETALQLKEKYGGSVNVLSMGPPSAQKAIREAIAMGCDDGILLTDRKFAGSDTWATAYTLAEAIRKIGKYDLVVCGERATDGDTGQVGPGIASFLDISLATYVSRVEDVEEGSLILERMVEEGYEKLSVSLPALITVVKEIGYPRLPTLGGKRRSRQTKIADWSADSIDLDREKIGLSGSPTRVVGIESPRVARGGKMVTAKDGEDTETVVDELVSFLKERELL